MSVSIAAAALDRQDRSPLPGLGVAANHVLVDVDDGLRARRAFGSRLFPIGFVACGLHRVDSFGLVCGFGAVIVFG